MPVSLGYGFTLAGSPRGDGHTMGRFVRSRKSPYRDLADRLRWFDAYDRSLIDQDSTRVCEEYAAERLPSWREEARGFAEAVGIPSEHYAPFLLHDIEFQAQCSHFTVLPEMTERAYSGHSWE